MSKIVRSSRSLNRGRDLAKGPGISEIAIVLGSHSHKLILLEEKWGEEGFI